MPSHGRKIQAAIRAMGLGISKIQQTWRKGQYEQLRPRLWQGQVEAALAHVQTLRPAPDCEPIKALEEAITSLENQRDWIGNSQQRQEPGYPEGLGLVERGVAVVINPRMKRRGMRGLRVNATAVVAVLFGHAIYALREEYGESTITVHEAHELQQASEALAAELVRIQQDMYRQLSSELASVRERLQQCEAASEARMRHLRQETPVSVRHPKRLVRQKSLPQQAALRQPPESFH